MHVAYFVHDLTDPAVAKRVRMLKLAGADALSFDVTAWAKTYGTFYALVPPDADTHCAVPDGIGSIYIRLERLKLPN